MSIKVRVLRTIGSPYGSFTTGHVVELPDEVAEDWIRAGHAERVNPPRKRKKPSSDKRLKGPPEDKAESP